VLDAHPLVRRGFEDGLGGAAQGAAVRAGFLRGRPDRRPPATLDEAREEVELFHAYCDAGLWNEADSTFAALDNPKHRFLAPAFERDLRLFYHLAYLVERTQPRLRRFKPVEVVSLFEQTVRTEMDLRMDDYLAHHLEAWQARWLDMGMVPGPITVESYGRFINEPGRLKLNILPFSDLSRLLMQGAEPARLEVRLAENLEVERHRSPDALDHLAGALELLVSPLLDSIHLRHVQNVEFRRRHLAALPPWDLGISLPRLFVHYDVPDIPLLGGLRSGSVKVR
jgi:hypothetical protein